MSKKDESPIFNMEIPEHKRFAVNYIKGQRGVIQLTVSHPRKGKTLNQLAYIFSCIYPRIAPMLSEATGESYCTLQTHEFLKHRFLRVPVVNRETGEELGYYTKSLRDLDVSECSAYIEQTIAFASENGIDIPPAAHFEIHAESGESRG